MQVGGDQADADPVLDREEPELEQIEGAVQREDAAVREVADVRGEPEQVVADADLLDQGDDLAIALKEVMVEVLDRGAGDREGVGLAAEALAALPERDLMPLLREAEGGGQSGDAAADDADVPVSQCLESSSVIARFGK